MNLLEIIKKKQEEVNKLNKSVDEFRNRLVNEYGFEKDSLNNNLYTLDPNLGLRLRIYSIKHDSFSWDIVNNNERDTTRDKNTKFDNLDEVLSVFEQQIKSIDVKDLI